MNIKVLGSGCASCKKLESLVKEVISQLGIDATVEYVSDFAKIVEYGVMATPGLVIDKQVVFSGSVPSKAKLTEIITTELAKRG